MPTDPVSRLLQSLDMVADDDGRFRVANPDIGYGERVFGGQVAAQAVRVATGSVPDDRVLHSLHAYFLRPGRPGVPIVYEVDPIRDGRTFTTRTVIARQIGEHDDEAIFEMTASFQRPEPGPVDYQQPIGDVPSPDDAPDDSGFVPPEVRDLVPMQFKEMGPTEPDEHGFYGSTRRVWMRIKDRVPDDPALHLALLTFLSDMGAVLGARAPLPEQPVGKLMGASLDHALWFHRPIRADEWFVYDLRAVTNVGSRGLAMGTMHSEAGVHGVSMTQEALLRIRT